jgi:hypothetical protein
MGSGSKAGGAPGATSWHFEGATDYDGDGKADILWRNDAGAGFVTEMNGTAFKSGASPGTVAGVWHLANIGDFDGDGKGDLLWRQADGTLFVTEMAGTTFKTGASPGGSDPVFHVLGDQHDLLCLIPARRRAGKKKL